MARAHIEEAHPLSERGIERQNERLLRRYCDFRRGADAVTTAWRAHPEVIAVSLIGSVARAPWKEAPRFGPYRRARVALWHECKDVDLALWLDHLDSLAMDCAGPRPGRCVLCGTKRPSASHRTRSTCSFSSPALSLPRAAVRFQRLSEGEGGMPGPGLRGCGAAASARGVQVATGEFGPRPCGPTVRTRDGVAASRERPAASRCRGWVTECRTEWGFCHPQFGQI